MTPKTHAHTTDDIIQQRAQKSSATHKKQPPTSSKKVVSNVDRSVATSRVKRDAAIQARRGITQSSKPTRQQIETAVQQQAHQTAIAKVQKQQKAAAAAATGGTTSKRQSKKVKMEIHKQTRELKKAMQPTKKQFKAAKKALLDAGFQVPPNHSLVITVQPATVQPQPNQQQQQQQQASSHPRRRRPQKKGDSTRMNTST
jgi:hypothetical protein